MEFYYQMLQMKWGQLKFILEQINDFNVGKCIDYINKGKNKNIFFEHNRDMIVWEGYTIHGSENFQII